MNFDNRFDFQDFLFTSFFVFMMLAVGSMFIAVPFQVFYSTIERHENIERSLAIEEKCLDDLWQKFKDSFNGLK